MSKKWKALDGMGNDAPPMPWSMAMIPLTDQLLSLYSRMRSEGHNPSLNIEGDTFTLSGSLVDVSKPHNRSAAEVDADALVGRARETL